MTQEDKQTVKKALEIILNSESLDNAATQKERLALAQLTSLFKEIEAMLDTK